MNWKGYVQIIPTDDQVERLEQAIKRTDRFLWDFDKKRYLEFDCSKVVEVGILFKKTGRVLDRDLLRQALPAGVSVEFKYDDSMTTYFTNPDYDVMKDIQQMIQAGSPLYLDNEMVKVWNKVQETIHDTQ